MIGWLRRHPLAAFLPLQAFLGFWNLGLLSPWMDEAISLLTMRLPIREVIQTAASDVHPPLYYLVLYCWQRLPLGLDWAVQARALSVVFALAATVAADTLWTSRLPERGRVWFLALWTLSPCLLLYSRMCRSYSLQLLIATIAAAYILRFAEKSSWKNAAFLAISLAAALYTHYVPGLALLAAANLTRAPGRKLVSIDAAVALVYLPWLWPMLVSIGHWSQQQNPYALTGATLFEIPVKLAYWALSFVMGEAVPDPVLVLGVALLPLVGFLMVEGARRKPRLMRVFLPVIVIGFAGVARWVSYPFIPARMLFVFPWVLLLLVTGAMAHRRVGAVVLTAVLALSASGIWCYFHLAGFRNKQYPMPMREIAAQISRTSSAEDSVILVDSHNSDPVALQYALGPSRPVLVTADAATAPRLSQFLMEPRVRTVWFLRSTRDLSPGQNNQRLEDQMRRAMPVAVHPFEAFSPLELRLMGAMGMKNPAMYFQELLEFRR